MRPHQGGQRAGIGEIGGDADGLAADGADGGVELGRVAARDEDFGAGADQLPGAGESHAAGAAEDEDTLLCK